MSGSPSSDQEQQATDFTIPPEWAQALFENAGHSIYVTDTEGTILYVNPAFEKTTGYSREEAVGENPRILQSGKHSDAFYQNLWETILSAEVWRDEILNRRKNGELYYVEQTISPIQDEAGNISGFVAINVDVTRRHTQESFIERLFSRMEEEHERLSRELHDQVGQKLLYVLLKLKQAPDSGDSSSATFPAEITDLLEEALDQIRDLSSLLRPASLQKTSLFEALKSHAATLNHQYDVTVEVDGTGHSTEDQLPSETKQGLYRIAQEALLNAIEHSGADHLGVVLNRFPERIVLLVEDNGEGFDYESLQQLEPRNRLGIESMKKRTRVMDGTFSLESTPGDGTRVKVDVPR